MQFSKLLSTDAEERAVSPVIGVILMVAITVILAAVIASFVLGLGQNQSVQPTANFDFNYDDDNDALTVTHTSGDAIPDNELYVRGDISNASSGNLWTDFGPGDVSGSVEGESAIVSGDKTIVETDGSDYVVRVVWEASSGESSAELAESRGPDA